jgi:hypothetical protein
MPAPRVPHPLIVDAFQARPRGAAVRKDGDDGEVFPSGECAANSILIVDRPVILPIGRVPSILVLVLSTHNPK